MNRLPAAAFAALVVATVGAFFVTQHLKVKDPLINGQPQPDPPAINPISGRVCTDLKGERVSFRRTKLSFYLQAHADTVIVSVVNSAGEIVATASPASRYMRPYHRAVFTWDGRQSNGTVAPDGAYYFHIALQSSGRGVPVTKPVQVITAAPLPRVTSVTPSIASPPSSPVTIHFTRGPDRAAFVQLYRTDLPGPPKLVKSFQVNGHIGAGVWNGLIHGRPAPSGTYLVGLLLTDAACNQGVYPLVLPPPAGTTPHSGITVRYLAAEPPLDPVAAGSNATVLVDSRLHPYTWGLRRGGGARVLVHGSVSPRAAARGGGVALTVTMPALGAGLYTLAIRSGAHRTVVPLIAAAAGRRAAARVLVVVPALSWQGENPVDDTGDGLPDTLAAGDRIDLYRPLANGLPAAFDDQLALLEYLDRHHLAYQLTSDVALAQGAGPALAGHTGVVLDGSFSWLPAALGPMLHAFAAGGGRVLSLGVHSLEATAPLVETDTAGARNLVAGPPSGVLATDVFGAGHGTVAPVGSQAITVIDDELHLFGSTSGIFTGFSAAQTITPPNGVATSLAGVADGTPAITGFRLGHGTVIEVGLPGFAAALAGDVDAQELLGRAWQILSG